MRVTALAIASILAFTAAAAADTSTRSVGAKAPKGDRVVLSTQTAGRQGSDTVRGSAEGRPQFGPAPVFTANAAATPAAPRTRGLAPERARLSFRMPWVTGVYQ